MKKFIALLIALMMALLCGCGVEGKEEGLDYKNLEFNYTFNSIESYKYYNWINKGYRYCEESKISFQSRIIDQWNTEQNIPYNAYNVRLAENGFYYIFSDLTFEYKYPKVYEKKPMDMFESTKRWQECINIYKEEIKIKDGLPINPYSEIGTLEGLELLMEENGKIIKCSYNNNTDYYKIIIEKKEEYVSNNKKYIDSNSILGNVLIENILIPIKAQIDNIDEVVLNVRFPYKVFCAKVILEKL